jgi:GNAT superfamily N-acetyltransferase
MKDEFEIRGIQKSQVADFSIVLQDVVGWLDSIGQSLWTGDQVSSIGLLNKYGIDEIYVGYISGRPICGAVIQEEDRFFWPDVLPYESLFIHKLGVVREYKRKGISSLFIDWVIERARELKKKYVRLDCAGDRPKLCAFYEKHGFQKVDRRMIGNLDTAFLERKVS